MDIMNVFYALAVQPHAQVIGGTATNTWVNGFITGLSMDK